jgi:hypothetical protein
MKLTSLISSFRKRMDIDFEEDPILTMRCILCRFTVSIVYDDHMEKQVSRALPPCGCLASNLVPA